MFTFQFKSNARWYAGSIFSPSYSSLKSISIVGPYVTLHASENHCEFLRSNLTPNQYSIVMPQHVLEHRFCHDQNAMQHGMKFPSANHAHLRLPGKKSIVVELGELLRYMELNNKPNREFIDASLINECVVAYQNYLNQASQDEHIQNIRALVMRWFTDYMRQDFYKHFDENYQDKQMPVDRVPPNAEQLSKKIIIFLNQPRANAYDRLRGQIDGFFRELEEFPLQTAVNTSKEVVALLPETTRDKFNALFNQNECLVMLTAATVLILTLVLLPSYKNEEDRDQFALLKLIFVFSAVFNIGHWSEKAYDLVSKVWVRDEGCYGNLKLKEVVERDRLFSSATVNITENEEKIAGLKLRF